jgi:hypothetical protein
MCCVCLLTAERPPHLGRIRAKCKANILYCFCDPLGGGFGCSTEFDKGICYEFRERGEAIHEESSSYRELMKLVNTLIRTAREGLLDGCAVFLYTDNQTSEASYFRGSAKSRAWFELIVTLYKLQMQYDSSLHVVWIAGTRMIQQGTDGLSILFNIIYFNCAFSKLIVPQEGNIMLAKMPAHKSWVVVRLSQSCSLSESTFDVTRDS